MKRMFLLAGALIAACAAQAQELRLSTFVPPVHVIYREVLTPWAEEVAKATGGALRG